MTEQNKYKTIKKLVETQGNKKRAALKKELESLQMAAKSKKEAQFTRSYRKLLSNCNCFPAKKGSYCQTAIASLRKKEAIVKLQ